MIPLLRLLIIKYKRTAQHHRRHNQHYIDVYALSIGIFLRSKETKRLAEDRTAEGNTQTAQERYLLPHSSRMNVARHSTAPRTAACNGGGLPWQMETIEKISWALGHRGVVVGRVAIFATAAAAPAAPVEQNNDHDDLYWGSRNSVGRSKGTQSLGG